MSKPENMIEELIKSITGAACKKTGRYDAKIGLRGRNPGRSPRIATRAAIMDRSACVGHPDGENPSWEKPGGEKPGGEKPISDDPYRGNADRENADRENADRENADRENADRENPGAEIRDPPAPDIGVLFSSPALYRTMAIFFDYPDETLFPRQIGRHTGTDIKSVVRELRKLERLGILYARGAGKWRRYGPNGNHHLYDDLVSIFAKTRRNRRYRLQESALAGLFL